jgi:hypothetical protein
MSNLIRDWAPLVNMILILVTGLVTVLRVRDALQRFENALEKITSTMARHGERLARIEATCKARCKMEGLYHEPETDG